MLDLGLLDGDRNRRILIDLIDPIVRAKNVQASAHSLVEAPSSDFDQVFHAVRIATGYFASSKAHTVILLFSCFLRHHGRCSFWLDRVDADGVEVVAVIIYLAL